MSDTGFSGHSTLGRGQRPCLAAGVCRDDGTEIGFGTGCASALVSISPKPAVKGFTESHGLTSFIPRGSRSWWLWSWSWSCWLMMLSPTFSTMLSTMFSMMLSTMFSMMLSQVSLTVFLTVLAEMPFGGVLDNVLKDFLDDAPEDVLVGVPGDVVG